MIRKGREGREEERKGREEAGAGERGFEDRSAAACFLSKAKGSGALSILFLHAYGGGLCRRISRIQSLHPVLGERLCASVLVHFWPFLPPLSTFCQWDTALAY